MKITAYQFGRLSTEEQTYDKDFLLTADKVFPRWWRKESHKLYWQDIALFVDETAPEILIVGQGKFGLMKVMPEVKEKLSLQNIELFAAKTGRAVQEFNKLCGQRRVLAAFHLTC
ncbi:MAG TPA: hypothetical protein ENH29_10825 [Bacteroidetes bacterium]|nr:hypothetical protein [Bacteroidota bacterium]